VSGRQRDARLDLVSLVLRPTEAVYFEPGTSDTTVKVDAGALTVPLLDRARKSNLPGGPSQAVIDRTTFHVDVGGRETTLQLPRAAPRAHHYRSRSGHRRRR